MSGIAELLDEISERIRGNNEIKKGFELLYKTTDKADVEEFHRRCDSKGSTITILYGAYNTTFGGYTSKDWSSPSKTRKVTDDRAFLFSKNDHAGAKCYFLPIKKEKADTAILCDPDYGPTFGANTFGGFDLQTFKRGKHNESECIDDFLYLNGSININNAYAVDRKDNDSGDQPKLKSKDINSGKMIVKRLEVYQVTNDEFDETWYEKIEENDFEAKRQKIIDMNPLPGLHIECYNILLLGPIGAGKSSFINTLSTVFTRKVVQIAPARQAKTSVTSKVTPYNIKTENGEKIRICIYDFRGFEVGREYGNELELQLEGALPRDFEFSDEVEDVQIDEGINPTLKDMIHLVCIVVDDSYPETYKQVFREQMEDIKQRINKKGLPLAIIATKFDLLCKNIKHNVDHLFKSPKAKDAVQRISTYYGVPKKHVFPVVNYIDETNRVSTKDQLALSAVHAICEMIEGHLTHHKDLQDVTDDWKDREKMLPLLKNHGDKRKILTNVNENFTAMEDENKTLRVLVVGPTGSGKSYFIDSISSALSNEVVSQAVDFGIARANSASSTTEKLYCMKYKYEDRKRRGKLFLGDTPGFQENDGIQADHVKFIINGNVPDKYKIINGIEETQRDFKREPTPGDKIHCVCFVFDCENVQKGLSDKMLNKMDNLLRISAAQGCPLTVVLTKCDKDGGVRRPGKHQVFQNARVRECKDKLMETFGFRQQQIFPVINYVDDNTTDLEKDALLLDVFFNILKIGKERLQDIEGELV